MGTSIGCSSDPNDSQDLPCSYVPVPDGPHSARAPSTEPHSQLKGVLLISCGLLMLVLLVAFNGYRASNRHEYDDGNVSLPTLTSNEELLARPTWQPVPRGVSAGVSEKSNRLLNSNINNRESYPWNNRMLSWQRTAFHFQPEKNWMNGNYFIHLLLLLHIYVDNKMVLNI